MSHTYVRRYPAVRAYRLMTLASEPDIELTWPEWLKFARNGRSAFGYTHEKHTGAAHFWVKKDNGAYAYGHYGDWVVMSNGGYLDIWANIAFVNAYVKVDEPTPTEGKPA